MEKSLRSAKKSDVFTTKPYVVNHLFGVGVKKGISEGISFAEALDYYHHHLFQAQLLRQPFPVAVPCLFLLAEQNSIRGQNGKGTERRDRTSRIPRQSSDQFGKRIIFCPPFFKGHRTTLSHQIAHRMVR